MPGVDGTSLGGVSAEVDGASLRPGDDTGASLQDLAMRGPTLVYSGVLPRVMCSQPLDPQVMFA
jgi:hypothetical protein